jgi:hypothetical protein
MDITLGNPGPGALIGFAHPGFRVRIVACCWGGRWTVYAIHLNRYMSPVRARESIGIVEEVCSLHTKRN